MPMPTGQRLLVILTYGQSKLIGLEGAIEMIPDHETSRLICSEGHSRKYLRLIKMNWARKGSWKYLRLSWGSQTEFVSRRQKDAPRFRMLKSRGKNNCPMNHQKCGSLKRLLRVCLAPMAVESMNHSMGSWKYVSRKYIQLSAWSKSIFGSVAIKSIQILMKIFSAQTNFKYIPMGRQSKMANL